MTSLVLLSHPRPYTPGPYRIGYARSGGGQAVPQIVGTGTRPAPVIAILTQVSDDYADRHLRAATARLLAAAPELLEALVGLLTPRDGMGEAAQDLERERYYSGRQSARATSAAKGGLDRLDEPW